MTMPPVEWPLPATVPEGLRVWRVPLDLDAPPPPADWAVLAASEAAHARRFLRPADAVRSVRTRAALRRLLGARLGLPAEAVPLAATARGRPVLAAPERLDFNVSHSGECALVAIAEGGLAVGVDVEQSARGADTASLEALVLSAGEIAAGPGVRPDFFTIWTAKEAVLKCLGLGITEHLRSVTVERVAGATPEGLRVRLDGALQGAAVQACALPAPPGYEAALAWAQGPAPGAGEAG
ncbi:4'-phosphopantetheinyl transferase superfamily protein [Acidovorax sp. NCPPB 2350]|nr:4'-phosphopantetheinyl transferase superfamily protein [Acidovorax sp. NCPPB 2350]